MESIEKIVADAILERKSEVLTLDGHDYPIAPPTLATVILISEIASGLPPMAEEENVLRGVLRHAKDCRILGDMAAVLVLGARRVMENRKVKRTFRKKQSYFSRILSRIVRESKDEELTTERENLAQIALNCLDPQILAKILNRRLIDMHVADFFAITTSLSTANIIKPTREVESPTQSGE